MCMELESDVGGAKTTEACDALVKCQYACDMFVICRSSRAPGSTNLHGTSFYLWFRSRFVSLKATWRDHVGFPIERSKGNGLVLLMALISLDFPKNLLKIFFF